MGFGLCPLPAKLVSCCAVPGHNQLHQCLWAGAVLLCHGRGHGEWASVIKPERDGNSPAVSRPGPGALTEVIWSVLCRLACWCCFHGWFMETFTVEECVYWLVLRVSCCLFTEGLQAARPVLSVPAAQKLPSALKSLGVSETQCWWYLWVGFRRSHYISIWGFNCSHRGVPWEFPPGSTLSPLKEAAGICILNGQLWPGLGLLDCTVFTDLFISCTGQSHTERKILIFISLAT